MDHYYHPANGFLPPSFVGGGGGTESYSPDDDDRPSPFDGVDEADVDEGGARASTALLSSSALAATTSGRYISGDGGEGGGGALGVSPVLSPDGASLRSILDAGRGALCVGRGLTRAAGRFCSPERAAVVGEGPGADVLSARYPLGNDRLSANRSRLAFAFAFGSGGGDDALEASARGASTRDGGGGEESHIGLGGDGVDDGTISGGDAGADEGVAAGGEGPASVLGAGGRATGGMRTWGGRDRLGSVGFDWMSLGRGRCGSGDGRDGEGTAGVGRMSLGLGDGDREGRDREGAMSDGVGGEKVAVGGGGGVD